MPVLRVKLYAREASVRLEFIAGIILGDILGLSWETVYDRRKIGNAAVINYSPDIIKGSLNVKPDTLLFESGISDKKVTVISWNNLPVFFGACGDSDFPFDIFAASFFLVTRYEEYLPHEPDEHGRFRASSSLAFRNGFLGRPVVDLWAREFSRVLLRKYPALVFRRNSFRALLTIDSDQPFAYLGKKLIYSVGGMLRDIARKEGSVAKRLKVVNHGMRDPFEVYDYILGAIDDYSADARYFFPTGEHSRYDKNPSWKSEEYRALIKKISGRFNIGIHPSYFAAERFKLLESETGRLRTITGSKITAARYHFIRLFMPSCYSNMIRAGINEDYSMGYPDEPGFRAGIARPYLFYDLKEERPTSLKIVPFQVMDGTLFQYRKMSPAEACEAIFRLIDETRKAGGLFVSIWHNTSLLDTPEGLIRREIFEQMLKEQQS